MERELFTHIPESVLQIAVLAYALAAASPMVVAVYLQALAPRWLGSPGPTVTYPIGLAALVSIGLVWWPGVTSLGPLWGASGSWPWLLGVAAAPALGWLAFAFEERFRRRLTPRPARRALEELPQRKTVVRATSPWAPKEARAAESISVQAVTFTVQPGMLALVAVLEELIFRGILIRALWTLLPAAPPVALVAFICVWFAAAHVQFGAEQLLLKLPLSLVATLLAVFGGVAAAAAAHVVFNLLAARQLARARPESV